jgi:hypothetical protein
MKSSHQGILLMWIAFLLLVTGGVILAQSSAQFNLERSVIGSGGGRSASASYRVEGTIGQSVASPPTAGSSNFTLSSGYWFAQTKMATYLPMIVKH